MNGTETPGSGPALPPMNATFVTQEELMAVTGYRQRGMLERFLNEKNIPFLHGKAGRILTTPEAINAALGVCAQPVIRDEILFEDQE